MEISEKRKDLLNYILQSIIFRHKEDVSYRITKGAELKEYMLFEKATALIQDMMEEVRMEITEKMEPCITLTNVEFDNVMAALRDLESQGSLGAKQLKEKLLRKEQKEKDEGIVLDLDNARALTVISMGAKYQIMTMSRSDKYDQLNGPSCDVKLYLSPVDRHKETAAKERLRADLDYCKALLKDLAEYKDDISRKRAERFLKENDND